MAYANYQGLVSSESPQFMRSFDGSFEVGFIVKNNWTSHLWKRTVADGAMSSLFPIASIVGNPLNDPIVADDTHYTLAVALDINNNLWLSGNHHNQPLRLCYANVTNWPPSTTWTTIPYAGSPWAATGLDQFSYVNFVRRVNGDLIFWCAQEDTTAGRDILCFRLPAGSTTWQPLFGDGHFATTPATTPVDEPDRVYTVGVMNEVRADGVERLWGCWLWARIGTGGELTHGFERQQPFVMYTDDLITWRTVSGQPVTMPKTWYDADRLTNNLTIPNIPLYNKNSGGFTVDNLGYPHVIVQNGANLDTATMPYWLRCYWNGTAWQNSALSAAQQGASVPPQLVALRSNIWVVTSAGGRLRCTNVADGSRVNMGDTTVPNGVRPWFEPIGAQNRTRISYLLPDGDTPKVFDLGVNTR